MRYRTLGILIVSLFMTTMFGISTGADVPSPPPSMEGTSHFIENVGQWDPKVSFMGGTPYGRIAFCRGSLLHYLINGEPGTEGSTVDVVEVAFTGSDAAPYGMDDIGAEFNYIKGNDPEHWRTGARGYREVVYEDVWEGIDLSFVSTAEGPKYEFRVGPGADPGAVRMEVVGGEVHSSGDSAAIRTPGGLIEDRGLIVYERSTGRAVDASFEVDDGEISFSVGPYDPSGTLVIDPLIASTYFAGTGSDRARGVCYDDEGNIYLTGFTNSGDLPTTPGSYDTTANDEDAYVSKLDGYCSQLIFSTYVGGSVGDRGFSLEVADNGDIIVVGYSHSTDFPTTSGAYQRELKDISDPMSKYDNVVFKLDAAGRRLLASTYVGASMIENAQHMAIDPWGRIVFTGFTSSTDYPITNTDIQAQHNGGQYDAFVTCLDANFSTLAYSILFGGSGGTENLVRMALDGNGDVYATGYTDSSDISITSNALESTYGGVLDGLVIGIGGNGTRLLYSSYFGGSDSDNGRGIAIAENGDLVITGKTYSTDFPFRGTQHTTSSSDGKEIIVLRIDPDDPSKGFATGVGGNGEDSGAGIEIDGFGNIWVGGSSISNDIPLDGKAQGPTGLFDGLMFCLSPDGRTIANSTLFGGTYNDIPLDMAMSPLGPFVLYGETLSNDLPIVGSPFMNSYKGSNDCFVGVLAFWPIPEAPFGLEATGGDHLVHLDWTRPAIFKESGSFGYRIFRGTAEDRMSFAYNSSAESFDDTNVTNGVTYYYKVCAYYVHGDGPFSDAVDCRPAAPPSAPLDLAVSDGDGWASLSWKGSLDDGGDAIEGYRIFRAKDDGAIELYQSVNDLSYNDTNVVNGGVYAYAVASYNVNGEGPRTDTVYGYPSTLPDAPRGLDGAWGDHYVNFSWMAPPFDGGTPVLGYRIFRAQGIAKLDVLNATNATYFNDTGLDNGASYRYAVKAFNKRGSSPLSAEFHAIPATVPDPIIDLTAMPGDRKVDLSWGPPPYDGGIPLNGYLVYRIMDGNRSLIMTMDPFYREFEDVGLTNGMTYTYIVTSVNDMGESLSSNVAEATPIGRPGKPMKLAAVPGDQNVTLSWELNGDDGGTAVTRMVLMKGESDHPDQPILLPPNATGYTDGGLVNGRMYFYRVYAENVVGRSDGSNMVSAIPATVPRPPRHITLDPLDSAIDISWMSSEDDGGLEVVRIGIYRGTDPLSLSNLIEIEVLEGTFRDEGLENGVAYYYALSSTNALGEGPLSEVVSAVPSTVPEDVVLTGRVEDGTVILEWAPPEDDGGSPVTGYKVFRSNSKFGNTLLATVNSTSCSDTTPIRDVMYIYTVVAFNQNGDGKVSNGVEVMVESEEESMLWLFVVIGAVVVILVAIALVGAVILMGRKAMPPIVTPDDALSPEQAVPAVPPAPLISLPQTYPQPPSLAPAPPVISGDLPPADPMVPVMGPPAEAVQPPPPSTAGPLPAVPPAVPQATTADPVDAPSGV